MSTVHKKQRFPLGLVLFALLLAVYKAGIISVDSGTGWQVWALLIGLDLFYFSFLLFLAILLGVVKPRILRFAFWLLLVFLTAIYLVDSFVLLALDDHADLFDIGRYALEDGVVLSFFDTAAYVAIASLVLSLFIFGDFTQRLRSLSIALLIFALLAGVVTEANSTASWSRYAMLSPASVVKSMGPQAVVSDYSKEQIAFYAELDRQAATIPASRPDIILVVVESLSSINSNRTSGVGNLLDGFDKLAEEGVLFPNFFANHQASEGGVIALLGGFPPMHFPTATPYMFDEFAIQPSVIGEYQRQGYFTEFLTNSDLSFIGLNHFLDGLGLNRIRGRDEIASMRDAARIVQDAPSDELLYAEALSAQRELSTTQSPFLMVLATTSTHLPYTHPEGGPDTAEAVWDWSLQRLTEFYRQLARAGFFEDGILLITGDHRQMRRMTKEETDRYGSSARARVPLLVIGRDYPRNTRDDRFFQQSDLLAMLDVMAQPDALLSPHPIWVERYNRKYGRIELIDNLSVFDQADEGRHEYQLTIAGNHIDWMGDKPEFSAEIEIRIHAQRSQHQKFRSTRLQ
jgi:phosphoglycerol transferase MdoB-like AlkP superfamily enzyme